MTTLFNEKTFFWMFLGLAVFLVLFLYLHREKRFKLKLAIHFSNNKNPFGMSLNTITLTDTLKHTGVISVTDAAGNTYSGTLANIAVTVSDATQDAVVVDPSAPNTIDVTDVAPSGGTTVAITADFTSQGNATPAAGSTAKPIPDGTVFPGLKGLVTIINAIPSTVQLQLAVNF